ncbi:F-box/kelch-repeat protein At3g23880-like [Argentina anserina]|uniref:F-box/kelch-repeat protein At3g23880-like n=1 Tax=Argentina anserina TaxID=57926 RepID=UPI00217679A8|nr:F-box/kelch-repeat protein At3g23880-like [Potentilla anserina]
MTKRTNHRLQLKPFSKPALKFLWMMIRKRKTPSLSSRRSGLPAGCAAVLTDDEDVLIEILARLPVKTLMRFRCVCKTWKSLIADPHFVKKHIKYDAGSGRALTDADLRLIFSMKPPSSMALADLKGLKGAGVGERFRDDLVAVREVEFPVSLDFVKGDDIVNVGSCNGIMCIRVRGDYVLWNPCTGEHNVLPKPSAACYSRYYGFGYDDVNDDYKVVKESRMEVDDDGWVKPMIQVFSLRKGTWMTYPGPKNANMRGQGAYMNGKLHWLWFEEQGDMESSEIWAFSLAEEKFHEAILIPLNRLPNLYHTCVRGIVICRNCLCVYSDVGAVRILMMKEYGVEESWTQVLYLTFHEVPEIYDDICTVKPLWILENGDVLAFTVQQGGYLSVYNAKDKAFRNVIRPERSYRFEEVIYRESLVSPVTGSPRDV